jgi:hypothetical protein
MLWKDLEVFNISKNLIARDGIGLIQDSIGPPEEQELVRKIQAKVS